MKRVTIASISGFGLIFVFLLSLLWGCGSGNNTPSSMENSGTGSVALKLQFGESTNPDAPATFTKAAAAPDICDDYRIDLIHVEILRASDNSQVVFGEKKCNAESRSLNFNNIPAGKELYVVCQGQVTGIGYHWRGESEHFTLAKGETRDIGSISMAYEVGTNGDTAPPVPILTDPVSVDSVPLNPIIKYFFSEPLAPSTIPDDAILLTGPGNTLIKGTVHYYEEAQPAAYIISFNPDEHLLPNTHYTYTLQMPADHPIADSAGLALSFVPARWTTTFKTSANHPPTASIVLPNNRDKIDIGQDIQFIGGAQDAEDPVIDDQALVWTSNRDGWLGTGAKFTTHTLCAGVHQITLTATDTGKAIGTATITLYIGSPVPDTGQTTSYTNTFGEDADYTINPPSYTKLDAAGNDLPDIATTWAMILDNVTGLIWENKTADSTIHSKDNTYTWQDAEGIFIAQLNTDNFGGHNDWRLPTVTELSLIMHADKPESEPKINTAFFANTMWSNYWSSTTYAGNTDYAWYLLFNNNFVGSFYKSYSYYVRAVRGGQSPSTLVDNKDGTISDTVTGLMWQKGEAGRMSWEAALTYCENLQLAGHSDWRLPNRNELQSIVDYTRDKLTIDPKAFPDAVSSGYWSSTTDANYADSAWDVYFYYGGVSTSYKSVSYYVRAVRTGQ